MTRVKCVKSTHVSEHRIRAACLKHVCGSNCYTDNGLDVCDTVAALSHSQDRRSWDINAFGTMRCCVPTQRRPTPRRMENAPLPRSIRGQREPCSDLAQPGKLRSQQRLAGEVHEEEQHGNPSADQCRHERYGNIRFVESV